ncbi:MAG: porphobilinogen synthase [Gemmatimonadota bacterium]
MTRLRRLRRTAALRELAAESSLSTRQFVHPMFIRAGASGVRPIASLPGHAQSTPDFVDGDVASALRLGVGAFLLFGVPDTKDDRGASAASASGPVPRAITAIRSRFPDAVVIADVCLCGYTTHGHCGLVTDKGAVDNDATLPRLARAAVAYADAGASIVAPSAMMDGQVRAIRAALDDAGHHDVAILSYAAKYASAFYGPFRDAAESAPTSGDRRGYQMDPRNAREAMREATQDVEEGADMLMVKPAGPYLDIVRAMRERFDLPLAAYQVSGEYSMIMAAGQLGWLDVRRAALESLIGIRRAGADIIITYFAREAARWLQESRDG